MSETCDLCGERPGEIVVEHDPYPDDGRRRKVRKYRRDYVCRYCYERLMNLKLREAVK